MIWSARIGRMNAMNDVGRIFFPRSPWPNGHRIERFVWSGRLDDLGLWFDLHLETASYREDGEGDESRSQNDWTSPSVWCNYHRCTISSVKWASERGVQVASATRRLDVRAPTLRFRADTLGPRTNVVDMLEDDKPTASTY